MRPLARCVLALGSAVAVCICTASPALAAPGRQHHHHQDSGAEPDGSDSTDPDPSDSPAPQPPPTGQFSDPQGDLPFPVPSVHTASQTITAEITGYSYQDNTPEGSATISMPVLHKVAGGTGTFQDPITTAVPGGASDPETPKGTKLYVGRLRRYFIVEDSGATAEGSKHFDLYVDGQGFTRSDSEACMDSYTGTATVILNPPPGEPVTPGPLTGPGGCRVSGTTPTTPTSTGAGDATGAPTTHAKHTRHVTALSGPDAGDGS